MLRFIGLLVLLVAISSPALGAPASDGEVKLDGAAGLKAFVTKRGGKIRVYREVIRNGTIKSTGEVEISITQIQEFDSNAEPLKSNVKLSSFANVDFTVTNVTNVPLPIGSAPDVFVDCLNCAGTLKEVRCAQS